MVVEPALEALEALPALAEAGQLLSESMALREVMEQAATDTAVQAAKVYLVVHPVPPPPQPDYQLMVPAAAAAVPVMLLGRQGPVVVGLESISSLLSALPQRPTPTLWGPGEDRRQMAVMALPAPS